MKIIKTVEDFRKYRKRLNGKAGLVPTMGYLHEGHLSLIRTARKECDNVIVTIFVNPTQFGPNEDLKNYPQDFRRDEELCKNEKVNCIFCPDTEEMYPGDELTTIKVDKITGKLCGLSRPTHFDGVTTVVAKLFNIIQADVAYFGQKDLQQSIVIKRMVKDLNIPIKIKVCPIVREEDGLAKSSRNEYLTKKEREIAPVLYESLQLAGLMFNGGERNAKKIKLAMINRINEVVSPEIGKIDYIETIDTENIENVEKLKKGDVIALAVFIGKARLIDNIML